MPAEAHVTSIWKMQRLFVVVFLMGIAGYFFWDGKIGYPRSDERWLAYEKHLKDNTIETWPADAASHGWTTKVPEKFHGDYHIHEQFVLCGLSGILGLIALGYWAAQKGRIVKTDGEAVFTPGGKRVPFESITGLGKKNWDKKGLATVRYEIGGRKGQFVLDDYKFDQEPVHQIVAEIEGWLLRQPATPGEMTKSE